MTAQRHNVIQTGHGDARSMADRQGTRATIAPRAPAGPNPGMSESRASQASSSPDVIVENKLKYEPELLLIGEVDGTIVGAVIAGFDGVRDWLYHLAVAPEFRRRGFATRLVREAEDGLRRLGCPKVNLQVRLSNHEVVAFYRSVGYKVEERVSMGRHLEGPG